MRYQGRIAEWNDDPGFGFIVRSDGGPKVFMHISALAGRRARPSVGALVTYEVGQSSDGRSTAKAVRFVGASANRRASTRGNAAAAVSLFAVLLALAYVAWVRISHPGSTIPASIYKIVFARDALYASKQFQCTPTKSSC
jgi:cold shock CspA family protein